MVVVFCVFEFFKLCTKILYIFSLEEQGSIVFIQLPRQFETLPKPCKLLGYNLLDCFLVRLEVTLSACQALCYTFHMYFPFNPNFARLLLFWEVNFLKDLQLIAGEAGTPAQAEPGCRALIHYIELFSFLGDRASSGNQSLFILSHYFPCYSSFIFIQLLSEHPKAFLHPGSISLWNQPSKALKQSSPDLSPWFSSIVQPGQQA